MVARKENKSLYTKNDGTRFYYTSILMPEHLFLIAKNWGNISGFITLALNNFISTEMYRQKLLKNNKRKALKKSQEKD